MTTHRPLSSSLVLSTLALATLAAAVTGCNQHPIKPVEFDGSLVETIPVPLDVNKKVDVLLVIDNSGSMGEEQANLAANFGPFIEKLEAAGADYRIGITTTDLGGKGCASGGAGGELVLSSCLDRPETFVFQQDDQFETACAAHCQYDDATLAVRPTVIGADGEAAPRPWIESYSGVGNLPSGIDTLEAFQCFAPQGISGCGWESPLEAMARALDNMQNPERPEHGFLRSDALLAVLIVTDEVDCSISPGMGDALFVDKTFWEGNLMTSAACWNAGVACSGESPFEDCWDVNLDAQGQETEDSTQMVLRPVSRYVEQLEAVAASKLAGREVLVSIIAGVPEGYSSGAAEIVYADAEHTSFAEPDDFQVLFGIGAGCQTEIDGSIQSAVPPVRLKTLAEAFVGSGLGEGARNIYSVCAADYTPAILDIVAGIEVELPPACFSGCVRDIDPSTDELDYSCTVLEQTGGDQYELPECASGEAGPEIPASADACWIAKTGAEVADECVQNNSNLEFELLRRPGVPVPGDVQVSALCELETFSAKCD
ncbi:MAG: VWA domain-containing protein [Enhygromyxa sp.]